MREIDFFTADLFSEGIFDVLKNIKGATEIVDLIKTDQNNHQGPVVQSERRR